MIAASSWILATLPLLAVGWMVAVLTPLALTAAAVPRWLVRAAWAAGALAAAGLALEPGALAIAATAPYAAVAALAGLVGVRRALGVHRDLPIAAGLAFLPGAAMWLVAHRAGYPLLGYPAFWVILTAAHFHVAGCYLAIVIGRVAHGRRGVRRAVAIGCVLAVPLTAAGIDGPAWLELGSALAMAACGGAAGAILVATRGARPAGAILLVTMPLAALYAARVSISPAGLDPLAAMLVAHGAPNALLFATIALVALARAPRPALAVPPPMSRLAARGHVGADFLTRRGLAIAPAPGAAPTGLVDRFADLAHPGLEPARVPAPIRAFYEHTATHAMQIRPAWRAGFRTGGRAWAAIARRLGQLQLPTAPHGDELGTRIVAVDPIADGRRAPRAWIRTFPDGRALYVAIYSTHARHGIAYMNIAFPLPGGHLSSILRVDPLGAGVTVSTRLGGDCGIFFCLCLGGLRVPIRLPMAEAIDVWTADDPAAPPELRAWATDAMAGATTVARHTVFLFGVRFLTLSYTMRAAAPV